MSDDRVLAVVVTACAIGYFIIAGLLIAIYGGL